VVCCKALEPETPYGDKICSWSVGTKKKEFSGTNVVDVEKKIAAEFKAPRPTWFLIPRPSEPPDPGRIMTMLITQSSRIAHTPVDTQAATNASGTWVI
jgi:hypothetical protein